MAPVVETLRPRVVGELACQRNSYLRTLETVIISCKEAQKENQSNTQKTNKKTKGESKRSSNNTETKLWEIEFADSVLFPEGIFDCGVSVANRQEADNRRITEVYIQLTALKKAPSRFQSRMSNDKG